MVIPNRIYKKRAVQIFFFSGILVEAVRILMMQLKEKML